ncbi:MAG: RagB/SusD family nutrient uptake outer membrane protein [Bacteroidales bacterium]|nr:RagB/SusD family nutrient uptake outer membrane protein [Bacteroidales bacterium]
MKKYITKSLLGVCLASSFTACDLDVVPPSSIATETFWQTEDDVWYAMNSLYNTLPGSEMYDEKSTDNLHTRKSWEGDAYLLQIDAVSPADYPYGYDFSVVRECNTVLANVDKASVSEELKERVKAETRFFRALSYLDLTCKFGKVPIIEEVLDFDAPNVERDDVESVHAFILKELQDAADVLPASYAGGKKLQEKSRITRYAALALRARAALYFGNYAEAEKSAEQIITEGKFELFKLTGDLTEAQKKEAEEMKKYIDESELAAAGITMDQFVRGLFSYETLWHVENASPDNPEYILTREYAAKPGFGDWGRYQYMLVEQLAGSNKGYSSYEPTQGIVDAYWDITGKKVPDVIDPMERGRLYYDFYSKYGIKDLKAGSQEYFDKIAGLDVRDIPYMKEFRNRDSRLYASILFPLKGWHEPAVVNGTFYYRFMYQSEYTGGNESTTGYTLRKFVCLSPYNQTLNSADYPVIRYAEVLLTYAEAHIQTTGWDSKVTEVLDKLRDRCGMPHVPASLGKEEALEFVRNERRIELFGEGHRFEDIRRYGNDYASKQMNVKLYSVGVSKQAGTESGEYAGTVNDYIMDRKWSKRLMLMPIPQYAIDSNPLLRNDQNEGY